MSGTCRDEFADYVTLGFDGLGYIATVNSTREEARRITDSLPAVSDAAWQKFRGSVEEQPDRG